MTTATLIDLRTLSAGLADTNLTDHVADVWTVARAAERAGVSPVLVDVLLNNKASDVTRFRALAMIGSRLERETATAKSTVSASAGSPVTAGR